MIGQNMSDRTIAAALGLSRSTVYRIRNNEKLPQHVRGPSSKIASMIQEGKSDADILEAVRIPKNVAMRIIKLAREKQ
jgi:predicted DNA-binding transcriptional regulator AlpA